MGIAPVKFESKIHMVQAAVTSRLSFGSDLHKNLKRPRYAVRTAVTKSVRKKGKSYVNPAMLLTIATKGHRVDPIQMEIY